MLDMAKKRPGRPRVIKSVGDRPDQVYRLRFIDPQLYDVVAQQAEANHRSINGELNVLLENALRSLGLWPPKPDAK